MLRLDQVPPFDRLDRTLVQQVAGLSSPARYRRGEWLVHRGQPSDGSLLVVCRGRAEAVTTGPDAEEAVVAFGPGDLVGVTAAVTGHPHPVGVRAATDVECIRLSREAVALCLADPAFAAHFSRILAHRLQALYGEVTRIHAARLQASDGLPFRRRVGQLMRRPAVTCSPDLPVEAAAVRMREQGISSLVVVEGGRVAGIVTVTDLVGRVLAAGKPASTPVGEVMSTPVETIEPQDFAEEALLRMVRRGCKHLPVVDADLRPLGMVTLGDLARSRARGALSVVDHIERARGVPELAAAVPHIDQVLQALVADGASPAQVLPAVTGLYDRLVRRLVDLAEARLGPAPCGWCWLQLGSAGREEQFARTDQDNAIVYAGTRDEHDAYFAALAEFVVEGLTACGFPPCPGGVMATSPRWRRPLHEWRLEVERMVRLPEPQEVRLATIFLDFRPVAGDRRLGRAVREWALDGAGASLHFLYQLVRDDLQHAVPIGPFRILHTPLRGERRGRINLKTDACMHVVNLLRVLALRHRVAATSTFARLAALREAGALPRDEADWIEVAYQTLMRLRIQEALRRLAAGERPGDDVSVAQLSDPERDALKDALVAVARLQQWMAMQFPGA